MRTRLFQLITATTHLPLLDQHYRSHRSALFTLLDSIELEATSADRSVLDAVEFIRAHRNARASHIPDAVTIERVGPGGVPEKATLTVDFDAFASVMWRKILRDKTRPGLLVRRHLEVCVFSYLASELRTGDIAVAGSDSFANLHLQLMSWDECAPLAEAFCAQAGIPTEATELTAFYRRKLAATAAVVELGIRATPTWCWMTDVRCSSAGRAPTGDLPLWLWNRPFTTGCHTGHCWTSSPAPRTCWAGTAISDPRRVRTRRSAMRWPATSSPCWPTARCWGRARWPRTCAGRSACTSYRWRRTSTTPRGKIDKASTVVINAFNQLDVAGMWGDGKVAAADGTQIDTWENNLLAETSIRYGGIAYRHVSNTYIALFSHFIPCGVWEAVYIIEGLLRNDSDIQPDTVHADTQGQSLPVFGLAALLGFDLLPRIRNWHDLVFYRPDERTATSTSTTCSTRRPSTGA